MLVSEGSAAIAQSSYTERFCSDVMAITENALCCEIEPRPGIRHVSPHPDQGLSTALPSGGHCGDHLALCSASTPPSLGQFVSLPICREPDQNRGAARAVQ
jgi:hypothetical protein